MINFPVAKSHGLTGVTLGMKNWYGILGGARNRLHQRIHESLADLADVMCPTLTLIDAYRVLIRTHRRQPLRRAAQKNTGGRN